MAKLITLTKDDEKALQQLTKMVEQDLSVHLVRYRPSMLKEFEYLVAEGFYSSIAEAIAEDLFFSNELYNKNKLKKVTGLEASPKRKAS